MFSMDNAGPPPTRAGAVAEAFPKFLQHICARDPAPLLLFSELLRCRRVCRDWRHALDDALPTSKHIDFRSRPAPTSTPRPASITAGARRCIRGVRDGSGQSACAAERHRARRELPPAGRPHVPRLKQRNYLALPHVSHPS